MLEDTIYLVKECPATLIPAGDVATLAKDSPVSVNQALGGSVTVTTPQGLFRIDREHWDALGEDPARQLEEHLAAQESEAPTMDGPFSEDQVWYVLKSCFDPEIPVNIVDLGLIYSLQSKENDQGKYDIDVQMTLTAQGCGMGPTIAADAKEKIESLPEVEFANVQIVWDPPWNPRMISEEGKQKLGLN